MRRIERRGGGKGDSRFRGLITTRFFLTHARRSRRLRCAEQARGRAKREGVGRKVSEFVKARTVRMGPRGLTWMSRWVVATVIMFAGVMTSTALDTGLALDDAATALYEPRKAINTGGEHGSTTAAAAAASTATSLLETEARLKDSEEKALELRREREAMEANIVELESVKVGKEEMNKKVQRLQRGWAVEREQAELVKQAMSNQHRQ